VGEKVEEQWRKGLVEKMRSGRERDVREVMKAKGVQAVVCSSISSNESF